jgi:Family of unknown function (DUF6920)
MLMQCFTEELVADLPLPARRYFLHAIQPGTPLAWSVCLDMYGTIRLGPTRDWLPMTARETLSPPAKFVWRATIGRGLLRLVGGDEYAEGTGRVRFSLWGIVPIVNRSGPDVSRSALGRLAAESCWVPSSLLPQRGVTWEALDDECARATMIIDGEPVTTTFFVSPEGKPRRSVLPRWGDQTEDSRFTYIPFGCEVKEEHTYQGYTIPSEVGVGWWIGTDRYFEFFRCKIKNAVFA